MTDWLSDFIKQHEEFESPISFWKWSALASISAVVKDNIYLDRYLYKLYPNIYVMLHAESGMKKGPPVAAASKLVRLVNNTKLIEGRSSIQGILKELGTGKTDKATGKIDKNSTAFICSSELSSSIVEDKVATKLLTDLYDRHYRVGDWQSLLKMESFQLTNPTVTMLTATNEAMGESFFNKGEVQGGFIARTFIIYESKRNKINSLAFRPRIIPDYPKSAEYLKELAKLRGPFAELSSEEKSDYYSYAKQKDDRTAYFSEAGLLYDNWYDQFIADMDASEAKDMTGTMNRFGDSVIKVAMLLSLAHKPELVISTAAMKEAIEICEKLLGNVRKTTIGKGGISASSQLKELIIMELYNRENHIITREMLMKKMWMHYASESEFNDLMGSFQSAGLIMGVVRNNMMLYQMPDDKVSELKVFFAGKMGKKE